MLPTSEMCKRWEYRLICIVLSAVFLANFMFFTDAPKQIYSWGLDARNIRAISIDDGVLSGLTMCSHTCSGVGELVSMSKFSSQCSIGRLTSFNDTLNSSKTDSLGKALDYIAKRPRGSSTACPRELNVANFPVPKTGLVSFPGSGNTWTRHLIQQLTGIHTGSIYDKSYISKRGFPYEGVVDDVIVIKSHKPPPSNGTLVKGKSGREFTILFERLLIILRNPYASFMAEFKRSKMHLGKVATAYINPRSEKWIRFVESSSRRWTAFATDSFNTTLPLLVIYYEDLQSCLLPELVKMSAFFHSRHLKEFAYCCALKQHEGSYHRAPSNQTIEDTYSSNLRALVNEALMTVASQVTNSYPEVAKRVVSYILPVP